MARTPRNFKTETQLGTTATTLTSNAAVNTQQLITSVSFFNQSLTETVTVQINRYSSTAGESNIIAERAIPPRQVWNAITPRNKVIENGFTLSAQASADSVINAECDGTLITVDA